MAPVADGPHDMTPRTDLQAAGDRDLRADLLADRADGHVSATEIEVVRDIAMRVEVDLELVSCVLDPTSDGCASSALP